MQLSITIYSEVFQVALRRVKKTRNKVAEHSFRQRSCWCDSYHWQAKPLKWQCKITLKLNFGGFIASCK